MWGSWHIKARVNRVLFVVFILMLSFKIHARELNYIQAHLFRLSGTDRPEEWIIPFYRYYKHSLPNVKFSLLASGNKQVPDLVSDLDSKDKQKIQNRLDQSYGKPYDASAKVFLALRYEEFVQSFSANAGAVAIVNDPVFPALEGLLYQDYMAHTSYYYKFNNELLLIPRVSYGERRVLDSSFTAVQLADKRPDTKLNVQAWKVVVEFSLQARYTFDYFDLFMQANSIPIIKNDYAYWDTNLGLKTKNLLSSPDSDLFKVLDIYLMYSPIYGGNYDVSRTVKLGSGIVFNDNFALDIFLQDEYSLGGLAKLNFEYFELSVFTFERSYDDFHFQKSRQYGLNLVMKY